jgi:hypothetical protein
VCVCDLETCTRWPRLELDCCATGMETATCGSRPSVTVSAISGCAVRDITSRRFIQATCYCQTGAFYQATVRWEYGKIRHVCNSLVKSCQKQDREDDDAMTLS